MRVLEKLLSTDNGFILENWCIIIPSHAFIIKPKDKLWDKAFKYLLSEKKEVSDE